MLLKLDRTQEIIESPGNLTSVVIEAHPGWTKGWLAKLNAGTLTSPGRTFLTAASSQLSNAGNGTKTFTDLENGLYEAESVWRSYKIARTVFRVQDNEIIILGDFEASGADKIKSYVALDEAHAELLGLSVEQLHIDREAQTKQKAIEATQRDQAAGLPTLIGSEKQIAWATTLRVQRLEAAQRGCEINQERLEELREQHSDKPAHCIHQ
jgi:hypothetical protein